MEYEISHWSTGYQTAISWMLEGKLKMQDTPVRFSNRQFDFTGVCFIWI